MTSDNGDSAQKPEGKPGTGYGHPPEKARFKPGQSGNPRGRPKGARGLKKIVEEIAFETHDVTEGGERTRRSTIEIVLLVLRRYAMSGNVKAFRAVHDYLQRLGPREPGQRGGFLILNQKSSREEWIKMAAEHQRKYREPPYAGVKKPAFEGPTKK
jgi:Family of unknown function (DUF5681)